MDILWPYINAEYSRTNSWSEEYTATLVRLLTPQDINEPFELYADRQLNLMSKLPFALNKYQQCAFILRMLNPYIRISLGSQVFSSLFQIRIAVDNFLGLIERYREDRISLIMNSIQGVKRVIEHDNFLPLPIIHYPDGDMRKLLNSGNYSTIGLKTTFIRHRLYESMNLSGIHFVCGFITLIMENGYALIMRMRITIFNSHSKLGRLLTQVVLLGDCDQIIHFHPYGRCPDEPIPVQYDFFQMKKELLRIGIIHPPLKVKLVKFQNSQSRTEESNDNKLPVVDVISCFDRFVWEFRLFNDVLLPTVPIVPCQFLNQAQQGIVFPSPFLEESNYKCAYYISPHFPLLSQIQINRAEINQKHGISADEEQNCQKNTEVVKSNCNL